MHRIAAVALVLGSMPSLLSAQPGPAKDPEIPADVGKAITTASGLEYSVLHWGKGKGKVKPAQGDKVKVHYTGWLTDGKVFDSSRRRGEPAEFILGKVIEGWTEGLKLMSPGDKFKFTIPPGLAYGDRGRPPVIPPKSTLIFVVELLGITPMPRYQAIDPKQAKKTESGLTYQVLEPGKGKTCGKDESFELEFAFYNQERKLIHATAQRGETIRGKVSVMRLPFLQEVPLLMKAGMVIRLEVPAKLGFGDKPPFPQIAAGATTYWHLKMTRITRPPKFELPEDKDLVATKSGLRFKIIKEGKGPQPGPTERVRVHYAGWLTDGTPFDSSYERGDPSTFALNGVIKGWTEGLQLMRPGAVYIFVIPGDLAYGKQGSPPKIGPDATLVFRIELISVAR